jgi:DNA mismatch endonuclease (patch repair protein)
MHKCRYGRVEPKTRAKFWQSKREGNVARDKRNLRKLRREGWKVLVIWECQTRNAERLIDKLSRFLASAKNS